MDDISSAIEIRRPRRVTARQESVARVAVPSKLDVHKQSRGNGARNAQRRRRDGTLVRRIDGDRCDFMSASFVLGDSHGVLRIPLKMSFTLRGVYQRSILYILYYRR